jgi:hypothetical protein
LNQEKVRSTTQRCGKTTKPLMSSLRIRLVVGDRSSGVIGQPGRYLQADKPILTPTFLINRPKDVACPANI